MYMPLLNMASRKRTATTTCTCTLTKFPVKQRKELGDNLACLDCEDVASEAIDKVVGTRKPSLQRQKAMMSNTLE